MMHDLVLGAQLLFGNRALQLILRQIISFFNDKEQQQL